MDSTETKLDQSRNSIWKSVLASIAVLIVLIPIVIGFRMVHIPYWPILIFAFYYQVCMQLQPEALLTIAVGGGIGILVSFSSTIVNQFVGAGVGDLTFLILLVVYVSCLIDGRFKYVNNMSKLFLICLVSVFPNETRIENLGPVILSYCIGVLIFFALAQIKRKKPIIPKPAEET